MPSTHSISSGPERTLCPQIPFRRTPGRARGLLRWSSQESDNQGGSHRLRSRAAVTCEIHAPGVALDSARAASSRRKSHDEGRKSPRLTCSTPAPRRRCRVTPAAVASASVNGLCARAAGSGCLLRILNSRTGRRQRAEVIHRLGFSACPTPSRGGGAGEETCAGERAGGEEASSESAQDVSERAGGGCRKCGRVAGVRRGRWGFRRRPRPFASLPGRRAVPAWS